MSTIPTISINGTSKASLLEETQAARTQCIAFLAALRSSFPHGRDYQGRTEDYIKAREEREEMLRQVSAIRDQLDARLVAIYDGGHKS